MNAMDGTRNEEHHNQVQDYWGGSVMARSSYIYVVEHAAPENTDPPHAVAAFTVKHELISWLQNVNSEDHPFFNEYTIYRFKDGTTERVYVTSSIKDEAGA